MLIELSKYKNMVIGALDEGALVGRVKVALVDPDHGKIIGFLVKEKGLFGPSKVVSILDVIDVEKRAMVINSRASLVDKNEIVRIAKILKFKFNLLGLPARTKDGQMLGRITDAVINSQTGEIIRVYTQFLMQRRVFERSKIEEITWQEILLSTDDRKRVKSKLTVSKEAESAA